MNPLITTVLPALMWAGAMAYGCRVFYKIGLMRGTCVWFYRSRNDKTIMRALKTIERVMPGTTALIEMKCQWEYTMERECGPDPGPRRAEPDPPEPPETRLGGED